MGEQPRCQTCGHPIMRINYMLGPEWMHYNPGSSFPTERNGDAWRYCKQNVATPPPVSHGANEVGE